MASMPLLSSRDGVQVVAALLGHARSAPAASGNVRALDRIFDEVVDSLRMGLPLRAEIEAGASAVAAVLNALHDITDPTHPNTGLPLPPSHTKPSHVPAHPRSSQHTSSGTSGSVASLPGASRPLPQYRARRIAQGPVQPEQLPLQTTHPQQSASPSFAQQPNYLQVHPQHHPGSQPHVQQQTYPQQPITSNALSQQFSPPMTKSLTQPQISGQSSHAADATVHSEPHLRPPVRRVVRKKRYHDAVPSTHCHVCCRPSTNVPMAVCSNIKDGTCRKVVCNRCILDNGWNWEEAISETSSWICPHCSNSCTQVPRAQCWVYMRTNSRRKNKKMRTAATDSSVINGTNGLSRGTSSASRGMNTTNRPAQGPVQPVAPYGPVPRGAYAPDFRATVQPGGTTGYVAVAGDGAGEVVGAPPQKRGTRGNQHADEGNGERRGR